MKLCQILTHCVLLVNSDLIRTWSCLRNNVTCRLWADLWLAVSGQVVTPGVNRLREADVNQTISLNNKKQTDECESSDSSTCSALAASTSEASSCELCGAENRCEASAGPTELTHLSLGCQRSPGSVTFSSMTRLISECVVWPGVLMMTRHSYDPLSLMSAFLRKTEKSPPLTWGSTSATRPWKDGSW